ncbi:retrovirus-related pol polyprotein from transposon TNT 1-94 [Tanacetum coccineum]
MRIEESLNVKFNESPPPKSPLVDDDIIEIQIIENQIEDLEIKENEPLNKEIDNIKESKDHPIDSVVEVYAAQPPSFVDFEKPNHVFKLKKALYGLKQAPKAWLQIKQLEDGMFFNQSKYIKEMFKKFGLEDSKPIKTSMSSKTKLTRDEHEESVDDTKYHGMIGSLLYLTASRPDIMFSVCLCARFHEVPKTSHLEAVKRIFRYIKGTTPIARYTMSIAKAQAVCAHSWDVASHRGSSRNKPP